ncbi:ADP-ribosylation factor GTPase-activating protein gcs1 [Paecilomyces lecythidis]
MSKMWEVDPETRSKASPKFGTFICLNCAGIHRGLGVHISFVRSITMDAFKNAEIQRMEKGGNEPWKAFFDAHPVTVSEGRTFEDSTIKERYEGEVGEEWKERLTCKIEGTEYVPGQEKKKKPEPISSRSSTPLSSTAAAGMASSATLERSGSRKERNEAYFAKLGGENSTRSASLPPSQGGKYTGFGGGLPVTAQKEPAAIPGIDDFQKDPMGTLTKGFGWFTSTVGKSVKTVNDSYLQPTAKQLAESDLAAQARLHAAQLGQHVQTGARGAADTFSRFVEGPDGRREPERKDFWDEFSSIGSKENRKSTSSIGTAAMKHGPSSSTSSGFGSTSTPAQTASSSSTANKGKDDWNDDW